MSTVAQEMGPWVKSQDVKHPPHHAHGDMNSLAPHEGLPEVLVMPREKTPTGAAA